MAAGREHQQNFDAADLPTVQPSPRPSMGENRNYGAYLHVSETRLRMATGNARRCAWSGGGGEGDAAAAAIAAPARAVGVSPLRTRDAA